MEQKKAKKNYVDGSSCKIKMCVSLQRRAIQNFKMCVLLQAACAKMYESSAQRPRQPASYKDHFFSSCRARSRLGRSSKRLVVDQLFSHCSRTGEKQKTRYLPKSKQNKPQTQTQTKQIQQRKRLRTQVKHYAFKKYNPHNA